MLLDLIISSHQYEIQTLVHFIIAAFLPFLPWSLTSVHWVYVHVHVDAFHL